MGFWSNIGLVFVAGLLTAVATGLGALPFFVVDDFSDRWNVGLWGLASGIMLSASTFGLINEGLAQGTVWELAGGLAIGVALVVVSGEVLDRVDVSGFGSAEETSDRHAPDGGHVEGGHDEHAAEAEAFVEGNLRQLVLILGVLTVHSFPEGVAVGVSFAELGLDSAETVGVFGLTLPVLAVFMTVAISIHNVPEGVAVSIPLRSMGVSEWRMVWWAVFSSLPQPLGAVVAYYFVTLAERFLPFGFGFAAGAMVYLVATEFVPEALERGSDLPGGGRRELVGGITAGVLVMVPLAFA